MSFSANNYCPICGNWFYSSECPHSIVEIMQRVEKINAGGASSPSEQDPKNVSVTYRGGRTEYVHKLVVFSAIEGPFFLVQTMNGDRYWHRLEDIQTITELHHWQVM
jgi:hypothetical protein